MEMMKAAVLKDIGILETEEVPKPIPNAGEVVVKVSACGVCGSDLPRILTTGTYHFPTIPGHEFGRWIYTVGDKKYHDFVGRKVAVNPLIPSCKSLAVGTLYPVLTPPLSVQLSFVFQTK